MQKQKALFLLIDSLRFDVLEDPKSREIIAPNLARIASRGIVQKVVTNAQSTQFVMPSLFSLTYPLDYGGYDNGIRERPQSFVECLKKEGFETHLVASCNQLGISTGYSRGFDNVCTTSDFRLLLEQRIGRTLRYQLDKKNNIDKDESEALVAKELGLLLRGIRDSISNHDRSIWPKILNRINEKVAAGCSAELKLLEENPSEVIAKIRKVAPGIYWRFLGQQRPKGLRLFFRRAQESIRWRTRRWIAKQTLWPFLAMSHFPVIFGDIIKPLCNLVEARVDQRWFIHMHMMDVHDCRSISRPFHLIYRFKYLPRWFYARIRGHTKRRWLYDTAIMYVDELLGHLLETLKQTGQFDNTLIVVTGDHGLYYAESPREKLQIGTRTHYEDIEVPMLLCNSSKDSLQVGMIDSMGVTATFIDALNITPDVSFKGVSALKGGRDFVISESCGHGDSDLIYRDIYFTVTTPSHKMMAVLQGKKLHIEKVYDKIKDPRELDNLVQDKKINSVKNQMIHMLKTERLEIFDLRGAK